MFCFKTKIDKNNKIHLPKAMTSEGFDGEISILPHYESAIIFPSKNSLEKVKISLEIALDLLNGQIKSKEVEKND